MPAGTTITHSGVMGGERKDCYRSGRSYTLILITNQYSGIHSTIQQGLNYTTMDLSLVDIISYYDILTCGAALIPNSKSS